MCECYQCIEFCRDVETLDPECTEDAIKLLSVRYASTLPYTLLNCTTEYASP